MPRLNINPRKLFVNTRFHTYEKLPTIDSQSPSPVFRTPIIRRWSWRSRLTGSDRWRGPRLSLTRILVLLLSFIFIALLFTTALYRKHAWDEQRREAERRERNKYPWEHYPRLNGFWNGIRTLVPFSDWVPEQEFIESYRTGNPADRLSPKYPAKSTEPPLDPEPFNPYPDYSSAEYLKEYEGVEPCTLDEEGQIPTPDIYAYPGIPQNMTAPMFGSYDLLGMNQEVCFERFGRFGPYGYSYSPEEGGLGLSAKSENGGADKLWQWEQKIDYRKISWARAQELCYEKNKKRFANKHPSASKIPEKEEEEKTTNGTTTTTALKKKVPRHAFILRTWTGYKYSDYQILTLRAMIAELALKSGGEYTVHFLVHVKDNSIPIWTSQKIYNQTIQQNLPREFWGMATLWSELQMKLYYPEPFDNNVANPAKSPVHSVYRSAHFALQWFSQVHPEYEYYWNWEMDMRLTGHYYDFHSKVGEWAKRQPRKGMWERSAKYYIPSYHGSWENFTETVEAEIAGSQEQPVWGPVAFENTGMLPPPESSTPPHSYKEDRYEWGVGEEADLLTFNPLFHPEKTNWVFRDDISGYDTSLPSPPRRSAIITVSRLSKRLLDTMHTETFLMKHHMFPEMWSPTVALHHGLKALYVPHAVFSEYLWEEEVGKKVFNEPDRPTASVFGHGEHNQLGMTFYYNAGFAARLWRRWLGARENGMGGTEEESRGTGRLCLRPVLFHPVKSERGAGDD